ncbi:MAG: YdbH domain-containing protein [Pseudomonadales bacterium]|nr:YdbH domain-containing protein [Pseudomonadales bacterium]
MLRRIIISVGVAVLLVSASVYLVWWYSPLLTEIVVKKALNSNGFELLDFDMPRWTDWQPAIRQLKFASEDAQISLTKLQIRPFELLRADYRLDIESLNISIQTSQQSMAKAPNWQAVFQQLDNNIAFVPRAGFIGELKICLPECQALLVRWQKKNGRVLVQINDPVNNLHLALQASAAKIVLQSVGLGKKTYLANFHLQPVNVSQLELSADGYFSALHNPIGLQGSSDIDGEQVGYALDMFAARAKLLGKLPLEGLIDTTEIKQQFSGQLNLKAQINTYVDAEFVDIQAASIPQSLMLEATMDEGQLQFVLQQPVEIEINSALLEQSSLVLDAGLSCDYKVALQCKLPKIVLNATRAPFTVDLVLVEGQLSAVSEGWNSQLILKLSIDQNAQLLFASTIGLDINQQQVLATGSEAELLGVAIDQLKIVHDIQSQAGDLNIQLDAELNTLSQLIDNLDLSDIVLLAGDMTFNAEFGWDLSVMDTSAESVEDLMSSLLFSAAIAGSDMELTYVDYHFYGGDINLKLAGWPVVQSTQPVFMTWQQIDIGLPLDNLNMKFDLQLAPFSNSVAVAGHGFEATILGGQMSATDYIFSQTETSNGYVTLQLDRLMLNQILALEDQAFDTSGFISGSVPVHLVDDNLSVSQGTIAALSPGGYIRYQPENTIKALISDNPTLKLVLDAMSDFQYQSLEADLEYSSSGLLVAKTRLKGSNPGYENGREIHFNLNLEENVDVLLQSLRLSRDVADKLGDRVEKGVSQ